MLLIRLLTHGTKDTSHSKRQRRGEHVRQPVESNSLRRPEQCPSGKGKRSDRHRDSAGDSIHDDEDDAGIRRRAHKPHEIQQSSGIVSGKEAEARARGDRDQGTGAHKENDDRTFQPHRMNKLDRLRSSNTARSILMGLAALLSASCIGPLGSPRRRESGEWVPGTATHQVEAGGSARFFLLHVPPRQRRNFFGVVRPYPLVLVIHGSGADGESIRHASQMDSIADSRGFLVAYPHGSKGTLGLFGADWNAGSCCGAAAREGVDDVAFLLGVIDRVAAHLPVNRRRVYVAGFSDGGRMAYRMACDAAFRITAVAVVAGSLRDRGCAPTVPVPLIAFHATGDDEVAFSEAPDALGAPALLDGDAALPPSVQAWSIINGCRMMAESKVSPHVSQFTFRHCDGAEVMLYSIDGGGHGWPGEPSATAAMPEMSELSASDAIVRFFFRYSR